MIWIYISIGIAVWWITSVYGVKWLFEDESCYGNVPHLPLDVGDHLLASVLGPFAFIILGVSKLGKLIGGAFYKAFMFKCRFIGFLLPGTYAVKLYNKKRCDHK